MDRVGVVIVAGGNGNRMGTDIPKQFLELGGRPILVHTLQRFLKALPEAEIVIVLPAIHAKLWHTISNKYGLTATHSICNGGENRFESVKNGLKYLGKCDYIAVHDSVRPLLSNSLIAETLATAKVHNTAIPAIEPVDSFRVLNNNKSQTIDRSTLCAIQTPQIFRTDLILNAYQQPYDPMFTDDASVVERSGTEITLCRGEITNIKITTPTDILIGEAILNSYGD